MAGADNRHHYIVNTVLVSQGYFQSIHIVDTGSTDDTSKIVGDVTPVHHHRIENWKDDWIQVYRLAMEQIPIGDWFLFADSDETPSQILLDNISTHTSHADSCGATIIRMPGILHNDGVPECVPMVEFHGGPFHSAWAKSHKEYVSLLAVGKHPWTKSNLVRRLGDTDIAAFGGHCGYNQVGDPFYYIPDWYNHYKTPSQLAMSIVLASWKVPESHGIEVGTPAYDDHTMCKKSTGLRTAQDLLWYVHLRGTAPQCMMDLWATWKDGHPTLQHYYSWAYKYNFQADISPVCGNTCCKYNNIQL